MGNWNDCPDTDAMMSVAKYWYEKYKAVPALISSDTVEYKVENPITDINEAKALAKEMCIHCSDIVFQGVGSINNLAHALIDSEVWYFWWD